MIDRDDVRARGERAAEIGDHPTLDVDDVSFGP